MNLEKIHLCEEFTLDLARGCLLRAGQPIHLRPQSYEVLRYLAENKGRLISKDQLIEEVWQGRAVTDGSLGKCIEEVRQALGENARSYVRNVRGRGYIFDPPGDQPSTTHSAWTEQVEVVRVVVEEDERNESAVNLASSPMLSSSPEQKKTNVLMLTVVGLIIGVLAVSAAYYFSTRSANPGNSNVRSLAILPFRSLGADS